MAENVAGLSVGLASYNVARLSYLKQGRFTDRKDGGPL